jgi:hypothetical protein
MNHCLTVPGYTLFAVSDTDSSMTGVSGDTYLPGDVLIFPDCITSPVLGADEVDWAKTLPQAVLRAARLKAGTARERFCVRKCRAQQAVAAKRMKCTESEDEDKATGSEEKTHDTRTSPLNTHPRSQYRNT